VLFRSLGAPALGISGSGYATSIVAWAMTAALAVYASGANLLPRGLARLGSAELRRGLREVLRLGLPIAGMWWLEIGVFSCSSLLMGQFGPVALAAHQICINLVSLTYMVPLALSSAATVRVGFHIGARAPNEARIAGLVAMMLGISFMVLAALALRAFARPIFSLYLDATDPSLPQVQALGVSLVTLAALFQVFDGTQCVASGALRGLMDVRMPVIAAIVGFWLLGLPIGAGLAFGTSLGPVGLWCGLAIGLVVVAVMLALRFRRRIAEMIDSHSATVGHPA
jgi:MATE family multidrug resistance protein